MAKTPAPESGVPPSSVVPVSRPVPVSFPASMPVWDGFVFPHAEKQSSNAAKMEVRAGRQEGIETKVVGGWS